MNSGKSNYNDGDGRMAAAQSSDGVGESDGDLTKQPHGQQINVPQSENVNAMVTSLLGQTSNLAPPSNIGAFPPQALPSMMSQPASFSQQLQPVSQASSNDPLPNQLSSVTPLISMASRLPQLHQAQAPTPSLNLQASLLNQSNSVPPPSSQSLAGGAPNDIMSLAQAQAQAQRTPTALGASWMNQINNPPALSPLAGPGLSHVTQSQASGPSSSLNPSLLGQLGLASLAQNVAGLLQIPQTQTQAQTQAQAQAQAVASLQPSLLNQLAAAQANQSSYLLPSRSASDQTSTSFLLQGLSASQNPAIPSSVPSIPPHCQSQPQQQQQNQQLIEQLIQDNMRKDQLIASLLSQLQQQVQTSIPNNNHTSAQMQTATLANLLGTAFSSNAANSASNLEGSHQGTSQASASASSFQHQPPQNRSMSAPCHTISNHNSEQHTTETPASDLGSVGDIYGPKKSKEKRWIMRYKELKEFHQKHGHCRVPHGFAENRKLSWWVMNQRAQYQLMKQGKKNWLSDDRIALLNELGFDWTPIIGKSDDR